MISPCGHLRLRGAQRSPISPLGIAPPAADTFDLTSIYGHASAGEDALWVRSDSHLSCPSRLVLTNVKVMLRKAKPMDLF